MDEARIANEEWEPATIDEVRKIVEADLTACDLQQQATFETYATELQYAPIDRYGKEERVVVVAKKGDEVIYYEDVEEGFNISPISAEGRILEHWCNQDELGFALNAWIEGRPHPGKVGPAQPIPQQ
jgi:predicted esterase YcpF (UPF0227 family)